MNAMRGLRVGKSSIQPLRLTIGKTRGPELQQDPQPAGAYLLTRDEMQSSNDTVHFQAAWR